MQNIELLSTGANLKACLEVRLKQTKQVIFKLLSGAVIAQSSISWFYITTESCVSWYCIQHCNDRGRTQIRLQTHKKRAIPPSQASLTGTGAPLHSHLLSTSWDLTQWHNKGRPCCQPKFPIWAWIPGELVLTSRWPHSGQSTPSWASSYQCHQPIVLAYWWSLWSTATN